MSRENAKISRLAIITLVLGILAVFTYEAIPFGINGWAGSVFGILALVKIYKSHGRLRGKGLAIAGIIISFIAMLFSHFVIHEFVKEEFFRRTECKLNQYDIYLALLEYKKVNNELPKNLSLLASEGFIKENTLYCPPKPKTPEKEMYYDKFAYLYYPENFGKKGEVLISEDINNHVGEGLPPVINEVMGDGELITKKIDKSR